MWLLTVVGKTHGLDHFTYVLEQKKTYSIGRDRSCQIRLDDKTVRMKEYKLEVKDWDPTNPPVLEFLVEPKKDGTYPSRSTLMPDEGCAGSLNKDDYDVVEVQPEGKQVELLRILDETPGQGLDINPSNWMFLRWVDMCLQYEKIKEEPEEVMDTLSRYCVAYTASFDTASPPNFVLSLLYASTHSCNFAVCFGVRILLPAYLHSLIGAINASWKQVADSQDSFSFPDELSPAFEPELSSDKVMKNRLHKDAWRPNPARKTLFAGWKIMAVYKSASTVPVERKFLQAMGAEVDQITIGAKPLLSGVDFKSRIGKWVQGVEAAGAKDRAAVINFGTAKGDAIRAGGNWTNLVEIPCNELGLYTTGGGICWGAVLRGDVKAYLDELASKGSEQPVPATAGPSTTTRKSASPEKARATPVQAIPEPSLPDPTPQALKIPSTFPDESAAVAQAGQSSTGRGGERAKSPQVEPAAPPARKPLKRRVGKPDTRDLLRMDVDEPSPSNGSTPDDSSGSAPRAESVQLPPAAQREVDTQSMATIPSQSTAPKSSRLKRRAGQPQTFGLFSVSERNETPASSKIEETPQEIRDLYEASKRGELSSQPKRRRVESANKDEDSLSSAVAPASPPSEGSRARQPVEVADGEDIEMEVEEVGGEDGDFVQKTLRQVAQNRKAGRTQSVIKDDKEKMPPPNGPLVKRAKRSPSEEVEVVEPKRARLASPEKSSTAKKSKSKTADKAEKTNQPTTDPAFLLAVSKSRSKKAIDEMDQEFNNLKIPKSALKGKQQQPDLENMATPRDYGILNDFQDEMRGNFIQVVRKDLYRKDGGLKVGERVEDGRPNFKKFKKKEIVRHNPVPLVLVGQSINTEEDEKGEPYWPGASGRGTSQMTQTQAVNGENEDSLPLLPRARNRKLLTQNEEDEDELAPLPSTSRRRLIPDSQTSAAPASRAPARKTRAGSTISEADSVASTGPSTRTTNRSSKTASAKSSATVGKAKSTAIVLEDSDDEMTGNPRRTASRSGAGTGTTGSRQRKVAEVEPMPASASASTSTRSGRAGPSSSSTVGKKKLLSTEDDDDVMIYQAAPKKRRLG